MPFATNTTCCRGRYTLLSKLGAGGQSEVWRARDHKRGEEIALKILNPDVARSRGAWEALQREHALVSRLDHPLILKVYPPERDQDEGILALPMELAPGGDLKRLRGVSYLEIGPVLLELAEALAHAHALGIVHRDLKPENVLFDARGHVRLADFGIAGTVLSAAKPGSAAARDVSASSHDLARTGGSPFTASPEQLRGDPPAVSDDIYGLGALAYELFSGHPPFYPRFDLKRVLEEPVPPLAPTHQTPARLIELVASMLAKPAAQRPGSMREVIDALDATLNDTLVLEHDSIAAARSSAIALPQTPGDRVLATELTAEVPRFGGAAPEVTQELPRLAVPSVELTQELPRLVIPGAELTSELPSLGGAAPIERARERPRASHGTTWLPSAAQLSPEPDAVRISRSLQADEETQSLDLQWARANVPNGGRAPLPPGTWPVRARSGSVMGPGSRRTADPQTRTQAPPWVRTDPPAPKRAAPGTRTPSSRGLEAAHGSPIPASARLPESWRRAVESASSRPKRSVAPPAPERVDGIEPTIGIEPLSANPQPDSRIASPVPDLPPATRIGADPPMPAARAAGALNEDLRALWADIEVERMPSLMRLEPERRSRWPWVLLAALATAVGSFLWLPRGSGLGGSIAQVHWPSSPEMREAMTSITDAARRLISAATRSPIASMPSEGGTHAETRTAGTAGTASSAAADRDGTLTAGRLAASGDSAAGATASLAQAPTAQPSVAQASVAQAPSASAEGRPAERTVPPTETSHVRAGRVESHPSRASLPSRSGGASRTHLDARFATLDARGAAVWGGADYAEAQARAAEAESAERAGDLATARGSLIQAERLLDAVEQEASHALAVQLYAGERALAGGNRAAAQRAFELAYRIDPGDPRAEQGLQRARVLDGLMPLVADGERAESVRDYSRAAQDYGQALALDPSSATARLGLKRVELAWGGDSYADAVSTGFAALGAGHLEDARAAFDNALRANERGREAREGMERVNAAVRSRGLAQLRSRAATLESEDRWGEALVDYDAALRIDPSLAFAREGRVRASARLDLTNRLEALVDDPQRLASSAARVAAVGLIREADAVPSSGAVVHSLAARLSSLLPVYDKTVHLALISDNETEVQIQQIGSFGTFSRREIDLKPGTYTVIGTRAGYRAVRRDVTVMPGQDVQTISVRCEEPI